MSTPVAHQSWQNRRVLVTGGAGFLGRRVVDRLADLGAEVFAEPCVTQ